MPGGDPALRYGSSRKLDEPFTPLRIAWGGMQGRWQAYKRGRGCVPELREETYASCNR